LLTGCGSEADKHVPVEKRMANLLDALKVVQGQQMVLGSALHTIMEKLNAENEQIDDQQAVLANSFKGLIDNVATRQDLEEIQNAAGEDNELHLELEDTTKKVQSLVKHMSAAQGHPEEDFEEKWGRLRKVVSESSLDQELDHVKEIVRTMTSHTEAASSSLWFFILFNAALLLGLLLWRSKGGYAFPR
jgi:chromosome segregation ATPase